MNAVTQLASANADALVEAYEEAYVDFLDSAGNELEDRLQRALRVSDLAGRMVAAGLDARIREIQESYSD